MDDFKEKLEKAVRLKDFAVNNRYDVDPKTIELLNGLVYPGKEVTAESWTTLDNVLRELTSATFPTTADTLSPLPESEEYLRFKRDLFWFGPTALVLAVASFVASAEGAWIHVSNSVLALSLGLLGAVVYSLFNVLRVVPPQAFNPKDLYSNYARLLLGVLLGWVFYFAFAQDVYAELPELLNLKVNTGADQPIFNQTHSDWTKAFFLLIPFVAGYSTKFVVGVLERVIYALEAALGIEEKRQTGAQRTRTPTGGG